ncbi:hypothetical protein QP150_15015 [Sphingomonas sp. 22L2VL55-3]
MTGGMLLVLALLQAIVAAPPPAGTPQPPATIFAEPAALFIAACDANGDGRVTQVELTAGVARSYATAEGLRLDRSGTLPLPTGRRRGSAIVTRCQARSRSTAMATTGSRWPNSRRGSRSSSRGSTATRMAC